jgi:hypothetical protein
MNLIIPLALLSIGLRIASALASVDRPLGLSLRFRPTSSLFRRAEIQVPKTNRQRDLSTRLDLGLDSGWWLALRGGMSDDDLAGEAFGWTTNLGAPAALVAGAVLATLSSTRLELTPLKTDRKRIQYAKKACRILLLSSFALEIFCIFVTTVTGTMLLSHGDIPAGVHGGIHYHSPMGFMAFNHEFEYLTCRVTFLQGLFHWLAATALQFMIKQPDESRASHRMNIHIASWLVSMILMIIQFYNDHIMAPYHNYPEMLRRYIVVTWLRYFWAWPLRPMIFLTVPSVLLSIGLGIRAFNTGVDGEDDDILEPTK